MVDPSQAFFVVEEEHHEGQEGQFEKPDTVGTSSIANVTPTENDQVEHKIAHEKQGPEKFSL